MRAAGRLAVIRKKQRRRKLQRLWNKYGYLATAAILLVVLVPVAIFAGSPKSTPGKTTEEITAEPEPETRPAIAIQPTEVKVYQYPFNTMSQDWEAGQLDGFKEYTIPEEYQRTGGEFPLIMQQYLWITCVQCDFDYATALAVVEKESGYKWDTLGAANEKGYMQIIERWHEDRMDKLNVSDIQNPFQNVRVGVDLLAELEREFGSENRALTAYNFGVSGAYEHVWDRGLESCEYSRSVMKIAERIRKELGQ